MTAAQNPGVAVDGDVATTPATTVDLPDAARPWLDYLRAVDDQIRELEEAKKVARRHIEDFLGDAETGIVNGNPVVHWTYVQSVRLDSTKLKQSEPDVWQRYAKAQTSRRFVVVEDAR